MNRLRGAGTVAGAVSVFIILAAMVGCAASRTFRDQSQGSVLYYSRCQSCHRPYDPRIKPESWWSVNLDKYADKAHLDRAERDSVMAFVLRAIAMDSSDLVDFKQERVR